jgi:LysM repeat protein
MCSIERLFVPSNDIENSVRSDTPNVHPHRLTSPTEAPMSTITLGQFPTSTRTARTAPSRQAAPHVRLTGRGKAVVLSVAVAVIGLLAILFGPSSTASNEIGVPQDTTTVRVMAGHTLWEIAAEANPGGDIRATVDDIIELNALPNASALQMGSEIAVPVYDR